MNERLMRAAPSCFAEFITAFEAEETTSKGKGPEPLWLIWQYEGDFTLWDLMQKKDFPYNLEQPLLGRQLDMPKGPQRKAITLSLVMQQVSLVITSLRFLWLSEATGFSFFNTSIARACLPHCWLSLVSARLHQLQTGPQTPCFDVVISA